MPRGELLIGLALAAAMFAIPAALACWGAWEGLAARRAGRRPRRWLVALGVTCAALLVGGGLYARFVEPRTLTVTRVTIPVRGIPAGRALTVVQLTDLHHADGAMPLERIVAAVAAERPDLILVTGDVMEGTPEQTVAPGRALSAQLQAIAPTAFVLGNHDEFPGVPDPYGGVLRDSSRDLTVNGIPVRLIGWDWPVYLWDHRPTPPDPARVNILLTHTPDLLPQAARQHVADVAFAGHTHGGQVRLPLWGAVLTATEHGKQYEYGLVQVRDMPAFISRGIGLTGPPVRFLCPPEIVVARLVGA